MHLYRINDNIYPDTNFRFSLTVSNLNLAPSIHTHQINDIQSLEQSILMKSDVGHTHQLVRSLFTVNPNNETELINIQIESDVQATIETSVESRNSLCIIELTDKNIDIYATDDIYLMSDTVDGEYIKTKLSSSNKTNYIGKFIRVNVDNINFNVISFNYVSPKTNVVDGIVNSNKKCDNDSIKFYIGNVDSILVEKYTGMILFEENEDA